MSVHPSFYLLRRLTRVSVSMFLPHPREKVSIVGSLRDREVACSASDRQGSNFESCVWRTVSSQSSHHPQEVLLAQFSLYVHKGGPIHFMSFLSVYPSFHMLRRLMCISLSSFLPVETVNVCQSIHLFTCCDR